MSSKVIVSFSAFGSDLLSIAFVVLHSLEGFVLWSSISTNCLHVFLRCLVIHLWQGGRGVISRSEIVSCSHPFQYFQWNWFRIMSGGTGSSVKRSENWSHPIPSIGLGRHTTTKPMDFHQLQES